ncbi:hypothetical protein NKR23_g8111 [Pleurostoma richardsiae]|uniref:Uncharacterized protein n=1 Tax=Pleurostoma richardsiae TaxID=41990 RepID=A0AA38VG74_9PEZI|nr:hypothetical protein NKR23_g8111 [Pleurostoma richardsiae]
MTRTTGTTTTTTFEQVPLPSELRFFMFSDPAETKTARSKRLVRSHVARASHAKHRQAQPATCRKVSARSGIRPATANRTQIVGKESMQDGGTAAEASTTLEHVQADRELVLPRVKSPLGQGRVDPFECFARRLFPIEHSLVDHYIRVLVPSRHNPCSHPSLCIDVSLYRIGMAIHWVAFCLTDVGVLHGLLLSSCRNIARQSEGPTAATYERYALYYKYHCIRSLRSSMIEDGSAPSDQTIAKSLLLAFDECMDENLSVSKRHLDACRRMAELRGGFRTLGLNGFLSRLLGWLGTEIEQKCNDPSRVGMCGLATMCRQLTV